MVVMVMTCSIHQVLRGRTLLVAHARKGTCVWYVHVCGVCTCMCVWCVCMHVWCVHACVVCVHACVRACMCVFESILY